MRLKYFSELPMLEMGNWDCPKQRRKNRNVMNTVNEVTGATSASAAASLNEQAINLLQAQMMRFQTDSGAPPGSVDFKALQYAIDTGNIVSAQAALARLHRDNQAPAPAATTPTPSAPRAPVPTANSESAAAPEDLGTDGSSINAVA